MIMEVKSIICAGYSAVLHIHSAVEEVHIKVCWWWVGSTHLFVLRGALHLGYLTTFVSASGEGGTGFVYH